MNHSEYKAKYELCEQLKDAGFDQKRGLGESRYLLEKEEQSTIYRDDYVKNNQEKVVYYPTLEEVMCAIEKPVFLKSYSNNEYIATNLEGDENPSKADNPLDAVIKLYIKLKE